MNNTLKLKALTLTIIALVSGCSTPGKDANRVATAQADAATETIQKHRLKPGIDQSVYSEDNNYVILGEPFKLKERQDLPEIFLTPSKFMSYRSKPLSDTIDYLNNKYASYGVYISFTSDAIKYLNQDSGSSKASSGTSDSTGDDLDVSALYTDTNKGSLLDGAKVSISLNFEKHVALKQVLDAIAAKTNLWWKYQSDGRVSFYRQETSHFRIDQYAGSTTLKSSINSSTSGGQQGEGTSSQTSSSHSYSFDRDLGKPMDQLLKGIKSIASEDAKVEVLPALSMVAVTDTPRKLRIVENFIDESNSTAGKMIRLDIELWELITTDESNYGIEQSIKYAKNDFELKIDGVPVGDAAKLGGLGLSIGDGSFKGTEMALKALQGTKSLSLKKSITTTVPNNDVIPVQFVNEKKYADKIDQSVSGDVVTQSASTDTTTNGIVFLASPRVNSDGTIAVRIVTDVSTLNAIDPLEVGNTQLQLTDRTVTAMVSARNIRSGETMVMTGFEQVIDNGQNQSVLGDLLWMFGGNDSNAKTRSVMLVIITPHIEKV